MVLITFQYNFYSLFKKAELLMWIYALLYFFGALFAVGCIFESKVVSSSKSAAETTGRNQDTDW